MEPSGWPEKVPLTAPDPVLLITVRVWLGVGAKPSVTAGKAPEADRPLTVYGIVEEVVKSAKRLVETLIVRAAAKSTPSVALAPYSTR